MPRQLRPGESGTPPLALNLHYLLTAYGRGESDNDAVSHRVHGRRDERAARPSAARRATRSGAALAPATICHAQLERDPHHAASR